VLELNAQENNLNDTVKTNSTMKTKDEWKAILTPMQFHVTRESGTERAFTGEYDNFYEKGEYACLCCGETLFTSDTKFKSGCGWPSFYEPANNANVIEVLDTSHGMSRTEIQCANCKGHLGHVFNDGPKPTGLRYCINSAALKFVPKEEKRD
jgi:methionine-R-sulfoxide reductase